MLVVTWAGAGFVPLFQQMQQLGVFDNMVVATGMGDNQTMAKGYADAVGSVGVSVYHYTLFDNPINNWLVAAAQGEVQQPARPVHRGRLHRGADAGQGARTPPTATRRPTA